MTLLAPFWLCLLLPWAAAWLRAGRGTTAMRVPFLALWPASPATGGPRRRWPPLWAILLLTAAGLAILAAAGPAVWRRAQVITVVVDRSPAMTADRLADAVARLPITADTRVHVVPSVGEGYDAVGGVEPLRLIPTVLANDDLLRRAMRTAPGPRAGPVIVLADHAIDGLPAEAVLVTPSRALVNAGIDRFALGVFALGPLPNPSPNDRERGPQVPLSTTSPGSSSPLIAQAMVRVFNGTPRTRATLRVNDITRRIELPPVGETKDYFIDLPTAPGETAEAALLAEDGGAFGDDVAGDDRAYLAAAATPARWCRAGRCRRRWAG